MMTREEVSSVVSYCEEHSISFKDRLDALSIPRWKFYDAKSYYTNEDIKAGSGEFINIRPKVSPNRSAYYCSEPRSHHKKVSEPQSFEASTLSVELQTPGGILMRIQGEMSASVLKEIITAANGYVQP